MPKAGTTPLTPLPNPKLKTAFHTRPLTEAAGELWFALADKAGIWHRNRKSVARCLQHRKVDVACWLTEEQPLQILGGLQTFAVPWVMQGRLLAKDGIASNCPNLFRSRPAEGHGLVPPLLVPLQPPGTKVRQVPLQLEVLHTRHLSPGGQSIIDQIEVGIVGTLKLHCCPISKAGLQAGELALHCKCRLNEHDEIHLHSMVTGFRDW